MAIDNNPTDSLHVAWQIPQYAIYAAGEVMVAVTGKRDKPTAQENALQKGIPRVVDGQGKRVHSREREGDITRGSEIQSKGETEKKRERERERESEAKKRAERARERTDRLREGDSEGRSRPDFSLYARSVPLRSP